MAHWHFEVAPDTPVVDAGVVAEAALASAVVPPDQLARAKALAAAAVQLVRDGHAGDAHVQIQLAGSETGLSMLITSVSVDHKAALDAADEAGETRVVWPPPPEEAVTGPEPVEAPAEG